ncbi:MAG: hypothetical protein K0S75_2104 [Clostridia bacterium]|jgi:hypothetical protein|nr:hypothetical protein [Clostridia bacterium]
MKKFLIILIFVCLYLIVGFFGLGPVMFADGAIQERLLTLTIVLLVFVIITYIFIRLLRKISN